MADVKTLPVSEQCCENCYYSRPEFKLFRTLPLGSAQEANVKDDTRYECRAKPPIIVDRQHSLYGQWPLVFSKEWCGEWVGKENV